MISEPARELKISIRAEKLGSTISRSGGGYESQFRSARSPKRSRASVKRSMTLARGKQDDTY